MGTIPYSSEYNLNAILNDNSIPYARGQRELGGSTGYEHWQLVVYFGRSVRLSAIKKIFGSNSHWELTRSSAADEYVWKDDTAVVDTRFEHGSKPMQRSSSTDWEVVRGHAQGGRLDSIPPDVYVRCYNQLKSKNSIVQKN